MPYCDHCGSHVSTDWERVYSIDGEIMVCPHCPDRKPDYKAEDGFVDYLTDHPNHKSKPIATNGGSKK